MKTAFISHGRTESGDEMPMVIWSEKPSGNDVMAFYNEALPEEFDAFGDEYMASLIHVQEAEVR